MVITPNVPHFQHLERNAVDAPVAAFCRISNTQIWRRSQVKEADIVIALDNLLFDQAKVSELKDEAIVIINTEKSPDEVFESIKFGSKKITIVTADLFQISRDIGLVNQENLPVINTSILGMVTRVVDGIELKDLAQAITDRFGSNPKAQKNIKAAETAAENAQIKKYNYGDN